MLGSAKILRALLREGTDMSKRKHESREHGRRGRRGRRHGLVGGLLHALLG